MANKRALIVYGGWDGHTPKQSGEVFAPLLQAKGFDVEMSDTLDVYADKAKMDTVDLVVPIWTMGQIKPEQEKGLLDAVNAGTGIAGFHGGMCDSFRNNTGYQWMTGGQWVAHPGNLYPRYTVKITDKNHEITRGLSDFELTNTERYWLHTDPGNKVLGTITFEDYNNLVMPYLWTRAWGQGKVFYAAWGHTYKDFDVPQAREIVLRGMVWASR
jgi:uncharacterized protein